MPTAPHLQTSQKDRVALSENPSESSTSSSHSSNSSVMRFNAKTSGSRPPLSSNNTTPNSTRHSSLSSLNHHSASSASSDASAGPTKRSSMKSNIKPSRSVGANLNRRSAPPTVRFLDPEPLLARNTESGKTTSLKSPISASRPVRPEYARGNTPPSLGPHQYQQKKIVIATLTRPPILSSASKRASVAASPGGTSGSPRTLSPTQTPQDHPKASPGPVTQLRKRVDKRFSAPAAPSPTDPRLDPRWSGIPLPAGFVPPSRRPMPTQRTTSYQSVVSNLSSPPTVPTTTLPLPAPSNKYDLLQNYIPCMAAMCTAHYTPAHSGPTYYAAQEPYNLSRHHGYCPRHASKEMKEANALCKKEYETMRQNAGRRTLGVIAQDFEIFLQFYRDARQVEDARLQRLQRNRVIGSIHTTSPKGKTTQTNDGFDWRYTPRNCTKKGCTSLPYSPFSTQFYSFYNTPNTSTQLMPLTSLCPNCSKAEAEGFGTKLMEKWSSRCGWDGEEWDGWYQNAVQARRTELEYWEKAQERVVREKLAKKKHIEEEKEKADETAEQIAADVQPKRERRQSIFKRMFSRSSIVAPPAVAAAAA